MRRKRQRDARARAVDLAQLNAVEVVEFVVRVATKPGRSTVARVAAARLVLELAGVVRPTSHADGDDDEL